MFLIGCAGLSVELVRVRGVEPKAAADLLLNLGVVAVDASEAEAFERVHISGALSMPPGEFWSVLKFLPEDYEVPILVYDARGWRSRDLAIMIINQGYNRVYELRGGLEAWIEEGLPVIEERRHKETPSTPTGV